MNCNVKTILWNEIKNIPGKKLSKKVVVLCADDYGSVRTRNKKALESLLAKGVPMYNGYFPSHDTLCSNNDLEALFDVLTSVKDANGHYARMTPFAIMGNPDFSAIRANGCTKYVRESFDVTLQKYGSTHNKVYDLWKEGIQLGIFHPVFHGVEHVSSNLLMYGLENKHKSTCLAFDEDTVGVPCIEDEDELKIMSTYYVDKRFDNSIVEKGIEEGLLLFYKMFGYHPMVFTPAAGSHTLKHNELLFSKGIRFVCHGKKAVYPREDGGKDIRHYYNGSKEENGMTILVKNCVFEPHGVDNYWAADNCLKQIEAAFRWHNPALISSHRANFSGSIDENNRKNSLAQLKYLYKEIAKRWPDVIFLNADELGKLLCNE